METEEKLLIFEEIMLYSQMKPEKNRKETSKKKIQQEISSTQDAAVSFDDGRRIEICDNGKRWRWRERGKHGRVLGYGGAFSTLSDERKQEYEQNKATYQERHSKHSAISV